jgi:hypothetical protein
MEQNTGLHKLLEAADLAKMVEELIAPTNLERLSPASISGIRITLKTLRESMLQCHDALAGDLVARARNRQEASVAPRPAAAEPVIPQNSVRVDSPSIVRQALASDQNKLIRKDLRSSLEQMVERGVTP